MDYDILDFEVGQTYRTSLNGMSAMNTLKIHIIHVLDGLYEGEKLIVFKYFVRNYWHADMYDADRLSMYIALQTRRNNSVINNDGTPLS